MRPLDAAEDAVFEAFRLLDNFNIPLGAIAAPGQIATDIESATQITTASDLKNRILYFHTMSDRQIRRIDLKTIDFGGTGLRFVEEPVSSDDRHGLAEVRAASALPIAAGESEAAAFDFAEMIERRAVDVLQPDLAIAGESSFLRIAREIAHLDLRIRQRRLDQPFDFRRIHRQVNSPRRSPSGMTAHISR